MSAFSAPLDIANRALDHVGSRAITSFTDGSRNAPIVKAVYQKLRVAELERNDWVFSLRKAAVRAIDTTTMLLVANAFNTVSDAAYEVGDIVTYNSRLYIAIADMPAGFAVAPIDSEFALAPTWDDYFGPLTVALWLPANPGGSGSTVKNFSGGYRAGEIAYVAPGNGTFFAFMSRTDGNTDDPLAPKAWRAETMYASGKLVLGSNNTIYQSTQNFNIGNDPTIVVSTAAWVIGTTYAAGAYAYYTDGMIYRSLVAGNVGHAPYASPTQWVPIGMWANTWTATVAPQPVASSDNWHFLACSLAPLSIVFPVSAGWASDGLTNNLFMLPNNFLKLAPGDDARGNKARFAGAASGPTGDDYIFQGGYLISQSVGPLVIPFVSDFQNVSAMSSMFCEGLGARMGLETCEKITQETTKQPQCQLAYRSAMREARMSNAIKLGPVQQVENQYVQVRV